MLKPTLMIAASIAALLAIPRPLLAQTPAAPAASAAPSAEDAALEPLFTAADQGDPAPLERALSGTRDPDLAALIRGRIAAGRFDASVVRDPQLARIAASSPSPTRRAAALGIIAGAAFSSGDYAAAQLSAGALAELYRAGGRAEEAAASQRTADLSRLLAPHGSQRVERQGTGTLPMTRDAVGLNRIHASVAGQQQEMVVDTGANLSVLSASAAQRLGIRVESTQTEVTNGVDGQVPVRVGVADVLEVAGTRVRNVAFLIIDDAQLTFAQVPGGYRIDAILGLPVLRALGRIRMERASFTVEAPAATAGSAPANLSASANDLYARLSIGGHDVPLLLDTGASQTTLSSRFATANPDVLAGLDRGSTRMASAGGAVQVQNATWPNQPVTIGSRSVTMPAVRIALPVDGAPTPRTMGTIGLDLLRRFDSFTLDFRIMRLEVGAPVPG